MATLSVALTPHTRQNAPSHSAAHNALHAVNNAVFPNGAPSGIGIGPGPIVGDIMSIRHGTQASPIAAQGATVYVSRDMNASTPGDINAAIWAINRNAGTSQPVGVEAWAIGGINTAGFYGVADNNYGPGGASFGAFFFPKASASGVGAIGVGLNVANYTGDNSPYTELRFVGFDSVYDGGGSGKYGGVGVLVRSALPGTDRYDVGYYNAADSIRTYGYLDDSSPVTAMRWAGSYTDGLDLAGTFSGSPIKFAAWPTWTPTWGADANGGTMTITLGSAAFLRLGKTLLFRVDATVTTHGTATGKLNFTLPASLTAKNGAGLIVGKEITGTTKGINGELVATDPRVFLTFSDASLQTAEHDSYRYYVSGMIEVA